MTNSELNTSILSLKSELLSSYSIYFYKMSIGSVVTCNRQRELLKAGDLYIEILDYYYGIPEALRVDESPITEDEVLILIAEANKVLSTFQSSYYVS